MKIFIDKNQVYKCCSVVHDWWLHHKFLFCPPVEIGLEKWWSKLEKRWEHFLSGQTTISRFDVFSAGSLPSFQPVLFHYLRYYQRAPIVLQIKSTTITFSNVCKSDWLSHRFKITSAAVIISIPKTNILSRSMEIIFWKFKNRISNSLQIFKKFALPKFGATAL